MVSLLLLQFVIVVGGSLEFEGIQLYLRILRLHIALDAPLSCDGASQSTRLLHIVLSLLVVQVTRVALPSFIDNFLLTLHLLLQGSCGFLTQLDRLIEQHLQLILGHLRHVLTQILGLQQHRLELFQTLLRQVAILLRLQFKELVIHVRQFRHARLGCLLCIVKPFRESVLPFGAEQVHLLQHTQELRLHLFGIVVTLHVLAHILQHLCPTLLNEFLVDGYGLLHTARHLRAKALQEFTHTQQVFLSDVSPQLLHFLPEGLRVIHHLRLHHAQLLLPQFLATILTQHQSPCRILCPSLIHLVLFPHPVALHTRDATILIEFVDGSIPFIVECLNHRTDTRQLLLCLLHHLPLQFQPFTFSSSLLFGEVFENGGSTATATTYFRFGQILNSTELFVNLPNMNVLIPETTDIIGNGSFKTFL